jgi:hypothetical protein
MGIGMGMRVVMTMRMSMVVVIPMLMQVLFLVIQFIPDHLLLPFYICRIIAQGGKAMA